MKYRHPAKGELIKDRIDINIDKVIKKIHHVKVSGRGPKVTKGMVFSKLKKKREKARNSARIKWFDGFSQDGWQFTIGRRSLGKRGRRQLIG